MSPSTTWVSSLVKPITKQLKKTLNETEFTKSANHQAISETVHRTESVEILLNNQRQKLARIQVFCYY